VAGDTPMRAARSMRLVPVRFSHSASFMAVMWPLGARASMKLMTQSQEFYSG
jgi:hypothetical protein